jgi:hypothetical protein
MAPGAGVTDLESKGMQVPFAIRRPYLRPQLGI